MVDYHPPGAAYQFPHRKPLPPAPPMSASHATTQQMAMAIPDVSLPSANQQINSTFSNFSRQSSRGPASSQPYYPNTVNTTRRTPSTSTTSTTGTSMGPSRTPSAASTALSRTASSRSGASITSSSYVALMRKQKATVWCDRAQHEDPRLLAQQKAAKMRAFREVSGPNIEGRTSTSGSMGSGSLGVRSKIRHHGIPKASSYSYANMVGGGVPARLSSTEVETDGYGGDDDSLRNNHQRTGSGRSSMGSNKYLSANSRQPHRYSEGSTPRSGEESSPNGDIAEVEETPVPGGRHDSSGGDYFTQTGGHGDSGSSEEQAFGTVGQMKAPTSTRREEGKSAEELRRRGSVDERANTMGSLGGVRLFVANPDLSD